MQRCSNGVPCPQNFGCSLFAYSWKLLPVCSQASVKEASPAKSNLKNSLNVGNLQRHKQNYAQFLLNAATICRSKNPENGHAQLHKIRWMRLFYLQLRSFCLRLVFFTHSGETVGKKDQTQFPDGGNRKQKRPNLISGGGGGNRK